MTAHATGKPSEQRLVPPFTELFFARQGSACAAYELMTPRNTAHIWAAATQLAAVPDAQLIDVQTRIPLSHSEWGRLPWVITNAPVDWYGELIDAVVNLGDDAAAGRCPIPRCTGEEMALHLVLEDITDSHDPALSDLTSAACAGLPMLDWDSNWPVIDATLFPNLQVRSLIADEFGGISDDYELVAETGIVRLGLPRWFDPYDECDPERPEPTCGCPALS
jgi:hypothetical protein